MKKKAVVLIYSAVSILTGILILLGFVFDDIALLNKYEGAETFSLFIQLMGAVMGIAGVGGVGWAIRLSKNPKLPGYAGLNGLGLTLLVIPFFFLGPFWLLLAWVLWLTPFLRA